MIHFDPDNFFGIMLFILRASTVLLAVGWLRRRAVRGG